MTGPLGWSVARAADWALGLSALGWAVRALLSGQALSMVGGTIAALNGLVGVLFLIRRPAQRWASAPECALCLTSVLTSGLALRVAPAMAEWPLGPSVVFAVAGLTAMVALSALGRSFGVLPALRGVAVSGPFRLVRHPAYAAELVMVLACVLAAGRWLALGPAALAVALVVLRIRIEERLLSSTEAYRAYAAEVRWRLLPGLW